MYVIRLSEMTGRWVIEDSETRVMIASRATREAAQQVADDLNRA